MYDALTQQALENKTLSLEQALSILNAPDTDTLKILDAAWSVRRKYYGNSVKVNVLQNAKSGICAENCSYCSQAKGKDTGIPRYRVQSPDELVDAAKAAADAGAQRYCMVLAGRGGSWNEVNIVSEATKRIKSELDIEVCACMGLMLGEDGLEKAKTLRASGVDAYNHNLNTHEEHYDQICTTHSYQDRVETLRNARMAGMSTCSGIIVGMGETPQQLAELALTLREQNASSIPVNFLIPIDGTELAPLNTTAHFTPWWCLRVLAMFRLTNPSAELRASAGREMHLRTLQPLALLAANSIFLGDYLTEEGQAANADWQMLSDLGLQKQEVLVKH